MKILNNKYLLVIAVVLSFAGSLFAQKFQLTANKTTVQVNERFQVDFTFEGGDRTSFKGYIPPNFNGFRILSGPNQSSSMTIINGSVSSTVTYSYILVARKVGKYTIGSALLKYKGKEYKTNSLRINVIKGSAKKKSTNSNQAMSDDELKQNVFIRAIADKRNVVKGEQVTVTYKLYTKLNISSPQISKLPQYKGFWAEELDADNNIRLNTEMYNGVRYRVATLKRVALFPTKSGKLTITPFELEIPVIVKRRPQRSNDPFDSFFNDSFFARTETINFKATSNKVTINVATLPMEGRPESFSGAVGDFDFKANIDKSSVTANDAITLKLEVSGRGNVGLIDLPEVKLPPGFEQYDPKTSKSIRKKGKISGRKTEEYLIVPRVPGVKKISPLTFSYYNPRLKKYITKSSPEFVINVARGKGEYASTSSGFSKEDVKLLSQDIRFIRTSNFELQKIERGNLIKSWFWGMLIFPLFLAFIVIGVKKRQDKINGNVELVRSRKAEKKAKERLKNSKKAMAEKDYEKYYEEISKGLFGYLEDKLQLQKSESSIEKVSALLKQNNIDEDVTSRVKNILEKCEFSRFAPSGNQNKEAEDLYNETVSVIVQIENKIKSKKKK